MNVYEYVKMLNEFENSKNLWRFVKRMYFNSNEPSTCVIESTVLVMNNKVMSTTLAVVKLGLEKFKPGRDLIPDLCDRSSSLSTGSEPFCPLLSVLSKVVLITVMITSLLCVSVQTRYEFHGIWNFY